MRLSLPTCATLVLACWVASCGRPPAPTLAVDTTAYPAELKRALEEVIAVQRTLPEDASVLYQVAAVQVRAGDTTAMRTLRRMEALRTGVHPRLREFGALRTDTAFIALIQRIRRDNPPVRRARHLFDVLPADLTPEGIAWSSRTRTLYLGSATRIVAVSLDGTVRDLVDLIPLGLGGVAGIRVDDRRGELWATSTPFLAPPSATRRGLFRISLATGALTGFHAVDSAMTPFVNDIAIAPNGDAFATGTMNGSLIRVDAVTGSVDAFLAPGSLPSPNGIAASADGQYLFVAGWHGIMRVDLRSREVRRVGHDSAIASGCLDGLYLRSEREIIGVQNCTHESGRVVRFTLNQARDRLISAEVLESYNPLFENITTAAIAQDTLYFIANVQFRKPRDGSVRFDPLHLLALPLR